MGDILPPLRNPLAQQHNDEALLIKSLLEIKHNRLKTALTDIETLLKTNPNFKSSFFLLTSTNKTIFIAQKLN